MPIHALTVRSLHPRALGLPMTRPIQTGGGSVAKIPLVLVDLETEEGITGCSYIFCYAAFVLEPLVKLLQNLGDLIKGDEPFVWSAHRVLLPWQPPVSIARPGMPAQKRRVFLWSSCLEERPNRFRLTTVRV